MDFNSAYMDSKKLFEERVLKHFDDNLFITEFSKKEGKILHNIALTRIKHWQHIKSIL